ncbi:unnamed protein product, partial [marine sediment metagenome]
AGIHYYTLKALVEGSGPENNSYATAEVHPDGSITITGYRKALSPATLGPNQNPPLAGSSLKSLAIP